MALERINPMRQVRQYSKFDKQALADQVKGEIHSLNTTSIAKVCLTDSATVELVLQELWATVARLAK